MLDYNAYSELVDQVIEVADDQQLRKFGLIAHSFGSYLCLRVLEKFDDRIHSVIMLNPIPFDYSSWQLTLQRLENSLSKEVLNYLQDLDKNCNRLDIFPLLFPYYAAQEVEELPEVNVNLYMCNQILAQINNFDDMKLVGSIDTPWVRIVGEMDPFYIDNDFEHNTYVIPKVGHYPFIENMHTFREALTWGEEKLW
jgi:pimeloyl-ACP methyl ester carboxylesterase